jgi:hypothetical protein
MAKRTWKRLTRIRPVGPMRWECLALLCAEAALVLLHLPVLLHVAAAVALHAAVIVRNRRT